MNTFTINIKDSKLLPTGWHDEDWGEVQEIFLKDPVESRVIHELMKVLEEGEFHTPILLEKLDGEIFVRDGTHRVVASILSGREEIEAAWQDEETFKEEPLASRVRFKAEERINWEEESTYFDTLRSLPLDEDNWLSADGATLIAGVLTMVWDLTDFRIASRINEKLCEEIGDPLLDIVTGPLSFVDDLEAGVV